MSSAGRHDLDHLRRPVARLRRPDGAGAPPPEKRRRNLRIGLLGGSFNPAHDGHRHVSLEALRRLRLDRVWWLVSPQNPLKSAGDTAELDERLRTARRVARHPRIVVTDVERRLNTRYTVHTLTGLVRGRGRRFVWLMGADNLAQMPQWRSWRRVLALAPVAVHDREPYSYPSLAGLVASAYRSRRVTSGRAGELADRPPPAWSFLRLRRHPASSTAIRRRQADSGRRGAGTEERS